MLGLPAILAVFFVGGLVVSVKIGGGTNLHNMDAYMLILLVVGAYLYYGMVAAEGEGRIGVKPPWPLLAVIVVLPVVYALSRRCRGRFTSLSRRGSPLLQRP